MSKVPVDHNCSWNFDGSSEFIEAITTVEHFVELARKHKTIKGDSINVSTMTLDNDTTSRINVEHSNVDKEKYIDGYQ